MAEKGSHQFEMEFVIVIDCKYGNIFKKHLGESYKR